MYKKIRNVSSKASITLKDAGRRLGIFFCAILVVISGTPAVAISDSQRKILNMNIEYFNDCLTSGGAIVAGDNKDYAGNQVFTDEELKKIEELSPFYVKSAEKYNMPWQILAVIHKRESDFMKGGPSNGQGPYQDYDNAGSWPVGDYDDALFQKATDRAAEEFVGKAGGRDLNDPDNVKYAFFGYNGRASVYIRQAKNLGFSEEEAQNGEGSPYVMNRADAKRDPAVAPSGTWGQIKVDNGPIEYPANNIHGAFVMFAALGGASGSSATSAVDNSNFIWVGDSRTVGMQGVITSGNNEWVAKSSMGYDWFVSEAIPTVNKKLEEDDVIVFNLGVNDLGNVDKYKSKLNELATGDWSKAGRIIVMSVNPVDEAKEAQNGYSVKNSTIEEFNKKIRNGLDAKIEFKDTYNQIKGSLGTTDGVHYDEATYKKLYDMIRGTESTDARCGETTVSGTMNEKIVQLATEWASWDDEYGTEYLWGGGHTSQADTDKRIENHFSNGYGIDCSGFVSAVIYKITGKWIPWTTMTMCSDTENFKEVTDPQPGDFKVTCDSHVAIILEVDSSGNVTKTSESRGSDGPSFGTYNSGKVLRYIGPESY